MSGVLQTAAVLLHYWGPPYKSVTPQKSYSAWNWLCWMEEAPPIIHRVALLMCSITSIGLRALKRVLLGSPWSGHHSIGDHKLRRKYGSKYGALWTCRPPTSVWVSASWSGVGGRRRPECWKAGPTMSAADTRWHSVCYPSEGVVKNRLEIFWATFQHRFLPCPLVSRWIHRYKRTRHPCRANKL